MSIGCSETVVDVLYPEASNNFRDKLLIGTRRLQWVSADNWAITVRISKDQNDLMSSLSTLKTYPLNCSSLCAVSDKIILSSVFPLQDIILYCFSKAIKFMVFIDLLEETYFTRQS